MVIAIKVIKGEDRIDKNNLYSKFHIGMIEEKFQ